MGAVTTTRDERDAPAVTRHARALALYCAGHTYREVAAMLDITVSDAHYAVHAACRRQHVRLVRVRRYELRPIPSAQGEGETSSASEEGAA